MRVYSMNKPFIGKYGAESENIVEHFTLGDSGVSENIVAYARYDELSAVWDRFDTDIEVLSSVVSGNSKNIDYLSGVISANIDNIATNIANIATLSSALGDSKSTENLSGMPYKDAIEKPVYDQLRRIYNDMTINLEHLNIVSGKTDFLHNVLNNQAAGLQSLDFTWLCGPTPNKDRTLTFPTSGNLFQPSNKAVDLYFERRIIQNEDILAAEPLVYSYNGTSDGWSFGLRVDHLSANGTTGDSEWAAYFCKIKSAKQVIASYFKDEAGVKNKTPVAAWQLATPDIWYVEDVTDLGDPNGPTSEKYTIIAFIAANIKSETAEGTDTQTLPVSGYASWKLYLVDNILTDTTSDNINNIPNYWSDVAKVELGNTFEIPFSNETNATN